MPSRWVCVAIAAFWLAATGWLVWREILPAFETGQPPPFTVDFLDEVEMDRPADTAWRVLHNGREEYRSTSRVIPHKEDETFELKSSLRINRALMERAQQPRGLLGDLLILDKVDSSYLVSREGVLREMTVDMAVTNVPLMNDKKARAQVHGVVQDGLLHVHLEGSLPDLGLSHGTTLDPVPVAHRSYVLTPLHPINRLQGLRPGQKWRMPFVEPLADALGRGRHRVLDAHVLEQPRVLRWRGRDISCLVIEFEDDDCRASTWVDRATGLVLRQEVTVEGDSWEMVREH
jgi:hypothetical protein